MDVGLVLSDRATLRSRFSSTSIPTTGGINNNGVFLAAYVSRAIWNHFTGMTGEDRVGAAGVDWNMIPGGKWGIWRSPAAPFPHPERANGLTRTDGTFYPYLPHYSDSSLVVFVPDDLHETDDGVNLIIHFHGHMNDNMGVLERYRMPQAMVAERPMPSLCCRRGPTARAIRSAERWKIRADSNGWWTTC